MAELYTNYSLKQYNTFGIDVLAKHFFEFSSKKELIEFIKENQELIKLPRVVIGGGSNLLFTGDFAGVIFYPHVMGIDVVKEDEDHAWIKAGAGVVWDDFVDFAVKYNYGGAENLSLIPGNVGACPVQNIGAYGVEVKDIIDTVYTINIKTLEERVFTNEECQFAYRDSIFKNELKHQYIVTHVTFKLDKKHTFKTEYGQIGAELEKYDEINISNIRKAIINIRESKLPCTEELGNAGSFFKNPVVDSEKAEELKTKHPSIPIYDAPNNQVKLAAGWLIDQCNWKGKRLGNAGVHKDQALVLVNHGSATGQEILHLAQKIQYSVFEKFGVTLEMEVNAI